MEVLKMNGKDWKKLSILTKERQEDGNYKITGYSTKSFDVGDCIVDYQQSSFFKIIKETNRRNAAGKWPKKDNKNNWFEAIASSHSIEQLPVTLN